MSKVWQEKGEKQEKHPKLGLEAFENSGKEGVVVAGAIPGAGIRAAVPEGQFEQVVVVAEIDMPVAEQGIDAVRPAVAGVADRVPVLDIIENDRLV